MYGDGGHCACSARTRSIACGTPSRARRRRSWRARSARFSSRTVRTRSRGISDGRSRAASAGCADAKFGARRAVCSPSQARGRPRRVRTGRAPARAARASAAERGEAAGEPRAARRARGSTAPCRARPRRRASCGRATESGLSPAGQVHDSAELERRVGHVHGRHMQRHAVARGEHRRVARVAIEERDHAGRPAARADPLVEPLGVDGVDEPDAPPIGESMRGPLHERRLGGDPAEAERKLVAEARGSHGGRNDGRPDRRSAGVRRRIASVGHVRRLSRATARGAVRGRRSGDGDLPLSSPASTAARSASTSRGSLRTSSRRSTASSPSPRSPSRTPSSPPGARATNS